jgi:hypothetical protein
MAASASIPEANRKVKGPRPVTKDTIAYLITLPIMFVIVIMAFKNWIPDAVGYCSLSFYWLIQK